MLAHHLMRPLQTEDFKKRGHYKCSKCGKSKRGHTCGASHTLVFHCTVQDNSITKTRQVLDQNISQLETSLRLLKEENELLRVRLRKATTREQSYTARPKVLTVSRHSTVPLTSRQTQPTIRLTEDPAHNFVSHYEPVVSRHRSPHLPPIMDPRFLWREEESEEEFVF